MVDLKNKRLIKIMWLPGEEKILFDIQSEQPLPLKSKSYDRILNFIDIKKWIKLYGKGYESWLNKDDSSIYDVENHVNLMMIAGLTKANETAKDEILFYWFDVDRTYNENFIWEYCPLSKKRLIYLGDDFPKINSLISPDYPLVVPSN